MSQYNRLLVLTACFVSILSTIGAALPYPILAPLFADGSINGLNQFAGLPPKLLLGIALAVNPLGLLLGSIMLGPLSDRYGRRPLLLFTTFSSAVGHAFTLWALLAQHYPLFVLARFVTGLNEGNTAIARAMLADHMEGDARTRAFAWLNGAAYAGWLLGPALAGATVHWGNEVPFAIAAVILFFTWIMGWFAFPHHAPQRSGSGGIWATIRDRHSFSLLAHRDIRTLFLLQFAYTFGVFTFYEFYPLWLVEFAHMGAQGISILTAALCLVMTSVSVFLGRQLIPDMHAAHLSRLAALTGLLILAMVLTSPMVGMIALVAFGIPNSLYQSVMPVLCAERFGEHGQGAVMGLLGATASIANVAAALVGAGITLLDSRAMLALGALACLIAARGLGPWVTARSQPAMHGSTS
ncbi:MFS transporter [Burkholderiaceae bacterium DAT-1]|nr:MFS transporter [Burkholderiaceae bacterium DAT-1]